jgi:hypothetical protein
LSKVKDNQYFYFKNYHTEQIYPTLKASFDNWKTIEKNSRDIFTMSLIFWDGAWSMTGLMAGLPMTPSDEAKIKKNHQMVKPWMLSAEDLNKLRDIQKNMAASFAETFQTPLPLFDTGEEMDKAYQNCMSNYYKRLKINEEELWEMNQKNDALDKEINKPSTMFEEKTDFGLFFLKNENITFLTGLKKLIQKLQKPNLNLDEKEHLFFGLTYSYEPEIITWVLANYEHPPLHLPVESKVNLEENISYYQRFYQPDGFNFEYPKNLSMV